MIKNLTIFLVIAFLTLVALMVNAEEVQTEGAVFKPWNLNMTTLVGFRLGKNDEEQTGLGGSSQESSVSFRWSFVDKDLSLRVKQPFYNSWYENGQSLSGKFSLGDTYIDLVKGSIGVIQPADVNISAGLRGVIPTSRVSGESDIITYIMPSLLAQKSWTKWSLSSGVASRVYLHSDKASKNFFRQILDFTASYQPASWVKFSTSTEFLINWKWQASGGDSADAVARLKIVPEVIFNPGGKLNIAAGIGIGSNERGDALSLYDVWLKEGLLYNSSPYARLSYTF